MIYNKLNMMLESFWKSDKVVMPGTIESKYVEVYRDPSSTELDQIYSDENGYGGVRIGIDGLGRIYTWIDSVDHFTIEKNFNLTFIGRFMHNKNDNIIYVSSGYVNEEMSFKRIPERLIKKMLTIFEDIKYIKTSTKHDILYEVK